MYDQFDKKISDRIKYVFDTYEDDSSDAGWKELRKSFPGTEGKRRPLLYWISSAAAVALLSIGSWLYFNQDMQEQVVTKVTSPVPSKQLKAHQDDISAEVMKHEEIITAEKSADPVSHVVRASLPDRERNNTTGAENETLPVATTSSAPVILTAAESRDSTAILKDPVYAQADIRKKEAATAPAGDDYIKQQAERLASIKEVPTVKKAEVRKDNKLSFGVYAGSFVNYSDGSKTSMNTGVGLSSEFKITKKLKIATGIALAQNTLKYDKLSPQKSAEIYLSVPVSDEPQLTNSFIAKTSSLSYTVNGYDASLLGLDIPVNIKYMFIEDKKELYLVAGLSSNYFIDEAYTYNYVNMGARIDGDTEEKTTTKTSSFDFARMLNFSVGFGYPVGKQSKLSLEPFIKYPLGGLGAQDIRFGSAGLNLKLNFSTK